MSEAILKLHSYVPASGVRDPAVLKTVCSFV